MIKFTTDPRKLVFSINKLMDFAEKKSPLEAMTAIRFQIEDVIMAEPRLIISVCGSESNAIFTFSEVKDVAPGVVIVDNARHMFSDALKYRDEETEFSLVEETLKSVIRDSKGNPTESKTVVQRMRLSSGKSKIHLRTLSEDEWPGDRRLKDPPFTFGVTAADLALGLKRAMNFVAADEARPQITGIYLRINADQLRLDSTEGHQACIQYVPIRNGGGDMDKGVILSTKNVPGVLSLLAKEAEEINVAIGPSTVSFEGKTWNAILSLIDGNYPDLDQVWPRGPAFTTMVAKGVDWLSAIERAKIIVSNRTSQPITITYDVLENVKTVTLDAASDEIGSYNEILSNVHLEGKSGKIMLSGEFCKEIFESIGDQETTLQVLTDRTPVRIIVSDQWKMLLMPLAPNSLAERRFYAPR